MICRIKQNLVLDFKIRGRPWLIPISLKNESRFDIGSEFICLKQGQYNMIRAIQSGTVYMEKGSDYETICVSFDRRQLRQLCLFFPGLHSFIHHSQSKIPAFVFGNHKRIDSQARNIVNHLLHCTCSRHIRRRYFDHKVKELALLLINGLDTENNIPAAENDSTVEFINKNKYLIKSGFNQSAILFKITRQLGMHNVKLQNDSR